ncbi:MAG: ATP-binding protein [Chitinispirillaceae bacterium]|nr:ATP-binding protein [Chitinispirillaceae bacterium]
MKNKMAEISEGISQEILASFQSVISDFQLRAEQLTQAYAAMRRDFQKLNLELDKKNKELQSSLSRIEEMQTYLDSILQSMESGVIGIDTKGIVTHFNRAAEEITGYDPLEVLNKPYISIFCEDNNNEPELLSVLKSDTYVTRLKEKIIKHKDGHPIPVTYHHSLLRDKKCRKLGAVEVFSDISRIKALEEEMQRTRTMAVLGEMSATVAHEIRNPLGAMGMWVALLEKDLEPEDPKRRIVTKITEGLSRLNKIVSNLLVFTRPVKVELKKVDIRYIVKENIDFMRVETESINPQIDIKYTHSDTPIILSIDPEKISQALLNLCLNGVQAMPSGGTLTVSVSEEVHGYVIISIEDTGCGIPEENLQKIFDPFFTTKEDGTGLGLAIVKKYVELHCGYIEVKSNVGKGSCFKIFLPKLKD